MQPLRILCIDDEPGVRELLHDCLENDHHKVSTAAGGKEGLEMFRASRREQKPFDVVITDLGMPEMDGYHLARAIKAESPDTPILMLTGWGSMIKADGESTPEVDAVLSKPPHMQELNLLLQRIASKSVAA
jgi:CheY-like chemotaxis protein